MKWITRENVHDHELDAAEWIVYDALYAYCQQMVCQGRREGAFR